MHISVQPMVKLFSKYSNIIKFKIVELMLNPEFGLLVYLVHKPQ